MAGLAGDPQAKIDELDDGIVMSFEPPQAKQAPPAPPNPETTNAVEYDEFGLPIKKRAVIRYDEDDSSDDEPEVQGAPKKEGKEVENTAPGVTSATSTTFSESHSVPPPLAKKVEIQPAPEPTVEPSSKDPVLEHQSSTTEPLPVDTTAVPKKPARDSMMSLPDEDIRKNAVKMFSEDPKDPKMGSTVSEWSHQQIVPQSSKDLQPKSDEKGEDSEDEWQAMPAYASTDLYDDNGRLIAVAEPGSEDEASNTIGGAAKGYTRVFDDEDADSVTSMDENTKYLFQEDENDEDARNPLSQMEATKELLTEGQRIAYVGVCRLALIEMIKDLDKIQVKSKSAKKIIGKVADGMKMWSQKMMVRLYTHMEISPPEQIMIEQLAEHGVQPSDLTPTLRQNFRVLNPMAAESDRSHPGTPNRLSSYSSAPSTPTEKSSRPSVSRWSTSPPPRYEDAIETPDVKDPSQIMNDKTLNIDLRWTVLCDLFLVLIADSVYDARARTLLERVGKMLDIGWEDICKFEKRVTDALEMQESTEQNWSEKEHIVNRDKQARNKRYMMLGLATVGGGLVIGLSGGLLAPVIGIGLAAGFSTVGVAGTTAFLTGAGGTALIAGTAVASGGYIGGKAGLNRVKSVQTFEFKPLHNAKRMNLIITVSGWMNGKIDDVRLPYSTVDPIMGDLFSIFWEPEMLQSMGQTINLLATEVLTQSLQQVLGNTILVALMASIQLPVVLTKLSYLIDNPWSVSLERAQAAGLILADTLVHRNLGVRPVTLVGYSLGARVVYYCLRELARLGAGGLVQNAYMFGTPVVVKKDEFAQAVSVVSGRFLNGYTTNDWILGYLFRATSGGIGRVAGLAPVTDIPGVENVDVTELVPGHMSYRQAMPKVLKHVGWEVISDEFTEIEDPDPENHAARQRELINELEEARKQQEKQPQKKKFFGIFGRKDAKKKDWETYESGATSDAKKDSTKTGQANNTGSTDDKEKNPYDSVLFDIDAIRAELAQSEKIEKEEDLFPVKEIEGTLPSLKITKTPGFGGDERPMETLRQSRSFNDINSSHDSKSRPGSGWSTMDGYRSFSSGSTREKSSSRGYQSFGDVGGFDYADHGEKEVQMMFEPPLRPEVKTSYTTPIPSGRNVWADDYEDEFAPKDEDELTMTFA